MTDPDAEKMKKLLEILAQEDLEEEEEAPAMFAEDAIDTAFPGMDDKVKEMMAKIMKQEMQTPEEIAESAKRNEHNALVQAKRDAKQLEKQLKRKNKRG